MKVAMKALLIEDNPAEAALIQSQLERTDTYRISSRVATCIEEGGAALAEEAFDIILLDFNLPDCQGLEGLERILAEAAGAAVIMLTNYSDEAMAIEAVKRGAQDYLFKRDANSSTLIRAIRYAVERQATREALRRSEERYALAIAGSNDGIWDWDVSQGRIHFSPRWKQMLGFSADELGDSPEAWFERIHEDDRESFHNTLDAHLVGALPYFEYEYRIRRADGDYLWVLCRGLAVRDQADKPCRMAGSMADISRRKHMEAQLMHEALHDSLTGLPNRTLFLDRANQAISTANRNRRFNFAVLYIDLDRFKNINDSLGHATGDALLKAVAKRLANFIRPCDTIARLGGDEFALLLLDNQDPNGVTLVADRIAQLLTRKFVINDVELFIGVSIGIAMGSEKYKLPGEILRDADLAMYRAKHAENRTYEVFDNAMYRVAMDKLKIESDLRNALVNDEFVVHYQPIIALNSGGVSGFEALLRWNHPTLGFLYPGSFIEIAEDSALIVPISWWVLEEACKTIGELHKTRPEFSNLSVSVNISGKLFNNSHTATKLLGLLDLIGFEPSALHLEITEHSIMSHQHLAIEQLEKLRSAGVGLHIDDFGTGYSSLSHLQKYSYDTLKIDSSFVSRMGTCNDSEAIVKSIVAMGNLLNMEVVAEGVETSEQLKSLIDIGCQQVQGFLFSPAVCDNELDLLLTTSWLSKKQPVR